MASDDESGAEVGDVHPGCCQECSGRGGTPLSGDCSDCLGTGHLHYEDEPCPRQTGVPILNESQATS